MGLPSFAEYAWLVDRLAPALLSAGARSAVVLAIAGAAVLTMRRASSAARYWVWLLGFVGVLLLPILSAALPAWRVLPNLRAPQSRAPEGVRLPIAPSLIASTHDRADQEPAVMQSRRTSELPAPQAQTPESIVKLDVPASAMAQPAHSTSPAYRHLSWRAWLVLGWLAGSLLAMAHMLLGYLSLWSLRRRCDRVEDGELHELLMRLSRDLDVGRPVELLSSPLRTMPMTWGVLSARMLLPQQAAEWPVEQRRAVLLHELGHVKRWDCPTQFVVQLGCATYWFNPIAWIACHRMQIERERACDDLVLSLGARPSEYARYLLHSISALPVLRLVGPAVAMARPSTLEERVRAILDGRRNRRSLSIPGIIVTLLVLLAAVLPAATLRAQQVRTQESPDNNAPRTTPTTRPATGSSAGRGASRIGRFGGAAARPTPGTGPTCAFDATIYDVRMPADQIGRLDVDALQQAAGNAQTFEKALAALGTFRPLYRTDQSVRLSGENVIIETQTPVITSTAVVANGHTVSNFSYHSTGAIFSIAGKAGATGPIDLDLAIQLSAIADSGVAIDKAIKAPVIRSLTISHKGPVQPRKAFVVVSVDANSPDASGKAVAYIGRIIVGEPQVTAPVTAGQ